MLLLCTKYSFKDDMNSQIRKAIFNLLGQCWMMVKEADVGPKGLRFESMTEVC